MESVWGMAAGTSTAVTEVGGILWLEKEMVVVMETGVTEDFSDGEGAMVAVTEVGEGEPEEGASDDCLCD